MFDGATVRALQPERDPFPPLAAAERLALYGPEGLTDADLLGVALGLPVERAAQALARLGGPGRLRRAPLLEVARAAGVGRTRTARAVAALALAERAAERAWSPSEPVRCGREVFERFRSRFLDAVREVFYALLLDGKNRLLREERISEGTLTSSLVHPREVFAPAVRVSAATLIVIHNHPSGDPAPSPEDREVTRRIRSAGEILGVRCLDHVVIGADSYVSFLEKGWL